MTTTIFATDYATKSTAARGAKRAGVENTTPVEVAGRWVNLPTEYVDEALHQDGDEYWTEFETVADAIADAELYMANKVPAKKIAGRPIVRRSDFSGVCKFVHAVAAQMHAEAEENGTTVSRKDVVAACIDQGVASYTARTQYQKWFSNR
jgi:hypothetical protein